MQPVFKGAATVAFALSMAGIGTLSAHAGGKSPPAAFDVTLENVSYDIHGIKLTYPKIDIKGSNLAKADIEKMIAVSTPSADRLKAIQGFSAGSVDILASNYSFEAGTLKVTASCTGEKMEKIAGGKIGKSTFSSCTGQAVDKDKVLGTFSLSLKGGGVNDYNLVHVYRLWNDKAGPEDKEAVAVSGPSTLEGLSFVFTAPHVEAKVEYGKVTEQGVTKIKLLSRPLKDVAAQIAALLAEAGKNTDPNAKGPTPEQIDTIKQIGLSVVELFENVQPGSSTIENMSLVENISDPKLGAPISIGAKIAKIETKGFNQQITDITFNGGRVTGKVGSFSLKDFSFAPFLTEAKKLLVLPNDQLAAETGKLVSGKSSAFHRLLASYYANIGTFSLNDFELTAKGIAKPAAATSNDDDEDEAPATPSPAPATPETVDFTTKLKNLTFRMEKPFNGIPTSFRFSFDNFQIPTVIMTFDGKAEALRSYETLKKVGVEQFNSSFATDLSWDKDSKNLAINEVKGADESFGSVALKGTIGNFSDTMFSWDENAIKIAALGLTVKDIGLHVEDKGGLDKFLKIAAMEQGASPEQFKAMVPLAIAMIPEPFASMNGVQTIRNAVLSYWQNPGKLDIGLKAKNAMGLGLADFIAASQDPKTIDAKLDVTATATK